MRRRTARPMSLILMLAAAFLSSGVAAAQGFGSRGGGSFLPRQRVLKNLSGITEDQLSQINALGEEFKATFGSFREEHRILRELLEAELKSHTPNATVVGKLVISQRSLAQQSRIAQEGFRETFQSILTLEQQQELEAKRNPRHPRHRGFGRGPGDFSKDGF